MKFYSVHANHLQNLRRWLVIPVMVLSCHATIAAEPLPLQPFDSKASLEETFETSHQSELLDYQKDGYVQMEPSGGSPSVAIVPFDQPWDWRKPLNIEMEVRFEVPLTTLTIGLVDASGEGAIPAVLVRSVDNDGVGVSFYRAENVEALASKDDLLGGPPVARGMDLGSWWRVRVRSRPAQNDEEAIVLLVDVFKDRGTALKEHRLVTLDKNQKEIGSLAFRFFAPRGSGGTIGLDNLVVQEGD